MNNEVKFNDKWDFLSVDGGRKIYYDDIFNIRLSESQLTFLIEIKNQRGIFPYPASKCHFYAQ